MKGDRKKGNSLINGNNTFSVNPAIAQIDESDSTLGTIDIKRLQALLSITDTALAYLALDDLLRELLERIREIMAVDNIAILLTTGEEQCLTVRATLGFGEEIAANVRVPVGRGFAGYIVVHAEPLVVYDSSEVEIITSALREKFRAMLGVPLLFRGRVIGVMQVGTVTSRRFSANDAQLLQRIADRVALAITRSRLYEVEQSAHAEVMVRSNQLEAIIETMVDSVFFYDTNAYLLRTNAAARKLLRLDMASNYYLGSPDEPAIQFSLHDERGETLPKERWPIYRILGGEDLAGENAIDVTIHLLDGRELEVSISGAPVRDSEGRIVGGVLIIRDMSERRQLEQRTRERAEARANELALREAQQRMDEFLSMASHELRTPLTTIKGNVQLSKRQLKILVSKALQTGELVGKIEIIEELLERADHQVSFLNRLVGDLLDVSRIQANMLELRIQPEPCDLVTIVREAVQDQRRALPKHTLHLDAPTDKSIPVMADPERIGHVVTNYLTNALKFSSADRPVIVSVCTEGNLARVSVRDEGPGLMPKEQERVWEHFYRVPGIEVQSGSSIGLGLGLHICKAIIECHHGQVGVQSAPGEGSTFWFALPLAGDS